MKKSFKKTVYLKQSRDALGRFGSVKKENPFKEISVETKLTDDSHVYYHKNQVKDMVSKAFLAGLNSKSSFILPSKQLERHLKEIGL